MQRGAGARGVAAIIGWIVLAVSVATVSTLAVNALGADLAGSNRSEPLSDAEVNARLAAGGANVVPQPIATHNGNSSTVPSGTASPGTGPPLAVGGKDVRVAQSVGGTVLFRCTDSALTVASWTPAQGYSVNEPPASGPTDRARVRFESSTKRVDVDIRCVGDVPSVDVRASDR